MEGNEMCNPHVWSPSNCFDLSSNHVMMNITLNHDDRKDAIDVR